MRICVANAVCSARDVRCTEELCGLKSALLVLLFSHGDCWLAAASRTRSWKPHRCSRARGCHKHAGAHPFASLPLRSQPLSRATPQLPPEPVHKRDYGTPPGAYAAAAAADAGAVAPPTHDGRGGSAFNCPVIGTSPSARVWQEMARANAASAAADAPQGTPLEVVTKQLELTKAAVKQRAEARRAAEAEDVKALREAEQQLKAQRRAARAAR